MNTEEIPTPIIDAELKAGGKYLVSEAKRLERELAESKAQVRALQEAVSGLEKDRAMLEWIEQNIISVGGGLYAMRILFSTHGKDIRKAIGAEMATQH